jgi:hypothetical protein
MSDQTTPTSRPLDDYLDFEEVELFADTVEERLNAESLSTLGSASSFSCAGGTFCSFGTIGTACTAAITL